ncbi:Na+/H+ antiporter NhaA [Glaciihabitans sp. GrIS 2.15]|uniref:Na+/H+ antiporter NhaA n=1 Tax=Glaciihabitans sp. GrIS 2.15 TaxID=3071710 RepID=UPI002E006A96|nr:NhaA family Na+:H+ antiporter [Glaciihabitans sp. GrIS 2.15]
MKFFRSERYAAFLLLGAAILGVILANSTLGPALQGLRDSHLPISWLGLDLSVGHWVTDGLLAIFFFLAAIELKHELAHGELDSARKALVPTIAAVGGVIAPAAIFLLMVPDRDLSKGWPIPTATDIAFALGALALVGRALPSRIRALLLALAVIDDLIAILIIAFFFTDDLRPLPLIAAVPAVLLFGWLSRRARSAPIAGLLIVLGIAAWVLVHLSGIHATIAGVALGLIMAGKSGGRTRHALEPWSNGIILPVFAFVAALVVLPSVGIGELSPVFWAIIVALPVGKLIGITGGALVGNRFASKRQRIPLGDIVAVAGLGGIGFTVSLLMNELAYAKQPQVAVEGTLAVLIASVIAAVIGVILTAIRARHYRSIDA